MAFGQGGQVDVIGLIAERKIAEAMEAGEFDNLPGAGRPLPEDEIDLAPPEIRMVLRILRNSGHGAKDAQGAGLPSSLLAKGSEVGAMARKMARLSLALQGGRKKAPRGRDAGARGPQGGDSGDFDPPSPDSGQPVMDSPYLPALLEKLGG